MRNFYLNLGRLELLLPEQLQLMHVHLLLIGHQHVHLVLWLAGRLQRQLVKAGPQQEAGVGGDRGWHMACLLLPVEQLKKGGAAASSLLVDRAEALSCSMSNLMARG